MNKINRREFVSSLAASTTLAASLPSAFAAEKRSESYSFLLLGDTHFDRLEHHDIE